MPTLRAAPIVLAGVLACYPTASVAQLTGVAVRAVAAQRMTFCQAEAARFSIPLEQRETFVTECRGIKEVEEEGNSEEWWFDVFGYAFAAFILFSWGYSVGRGRKYAAIVKGRRAGRGG